MASLFGVERLLMGTDYPYDMGEYDPIGHIASVDPSATPIGRQLPAEMRRRCLDFRKAVPQQAGPLLYRHGRACPCQVRTSWKRSTAVVARIVMARLVRTGANIAGHVAIP